MSRKLRGRGLRAGLFPRLQPLDGLLEPRLHMGEDSALVCHVLFLPQRDWQDCLPIFLDNENETQAPALTDVVRFQRPSGLADIYRPDAWNAVSLAWIFGKAPERVLNIPFRQRTIFRKRSRSFSNTGFARTS